MAKGIFEIEAINSGSSLSIKEIATKIYTLYIRLGCIDSLFYCPTISISQKKEEEIDLQSCNFSDVIEYIANCILAYNLSDIRQYDKIIHPTLDYHREYGFHFSLRFGNILNLYHIFGCLKRDCIFTPSINPALNKDFNWYNSVLKEIVETMYSVEGCIKLSNTRLFSNTSLPYITTVKLIIKCRI